MTVLAWAVKTKDDRRFIDEMMRVDIWNCAEAQYGRRLYIACAIGQPLRALSSTSHRLVAMLQRYREPDIGKSDFEIRAALIDAFRGNRSWLTHEAYLLNDHKPDEKLVLVPKPLRGNGMRISPM